MAEVREIDYLHLAAYGAVPKFKGVMGDMRRGHVYSYGAIYIYILRDPLVTQILRRTG